MAYMAQPLMDAKPIVQEAGIDDPVRLIAPLELYVAPPELDGSRGDHRLPAEWCTISARTDKEAVWCWLHSSVRTSGGYEGGKHAAEQLMNWACFVRGKALSSLGNSDFLAFADFVSKPSSDLCGAPGTRRTDPRWRPFTRPLAPRSRRTLLARLHGLAVWLQAVRYANLRWLCTRQELHEGLQGVAIQAVMDRKGVKPAMAQDEWHWVCRALDMFEGSGFHGDRRLLIYLLYFGQLTVAEIARLQVSDLCPPTSDCQLWRLRVPSRRPDRVQIYALPPLSAALDRWIDPSDGIDETGWGDVDDGSPLLFPMGAGIYGKVDAVIARAADLAKREAPEVASRLRCLHSDALRRGALLINLPGSWLWRFVASALDPSTWTFVYLYDERLRGLTRMELRQGLLALQPLWANVAVPQQRKRPDESRRTTQGQDQLRMPALQAGELAFRFGTGRRSLRPLLTDLSYGRSYNPAMVIYRCIDRHIRKHVLGGRYMSAMPLIVRADPGYIAASIETDSRARLLWAFVLWCFTLEPTILRRRWMGPTSRSDEAIGLELASHYEPAEGLPRVFKVNRGLWDWTCMHHSSQVMLSLWTSAVEAAEKMAQSGDVKWGPGTVRCSKMPVSGYHTASEGTELRIGRSADIRLSAADRQSKPQRVHAARQASKERAASIAKSCAGHCLTFDGEWKVMQATLPSLGGDPCMAVRRRRLPGVPTRPAFWLFPQAGGGVVARLCDVPLEVRATTWFEAIELLRAATRQRLRAGFPLPPRTRGPTVVPTQSRDDILLSRQLAALATRSGFWRDGEQIVRAWRMNRMHAVERLGLVAATLAGRDAGDGAQPDCPVGYRRLP